MMDFFDDDFGTDNENNGFQDDFTDDFFNDDGFDTDSHEAAPAARPKFNRARVSPEPINIDAAASPQEQYAMLFAKAANASPEYRDIPDYREIPEYQDVPVNRESEAPAYREESVQRETPVSEEVPAYQEFPSESETSDDYEEPAKEKNPAECIVQYVDCHYKFLPCGVDVNELNRKYLYGLQYGLDWGYTTVIIPITAEFSQHLCFDENNRQYAVDELREMRRDSIAAAAEIAGTDMLSSSYINKTSIIAKRGVDIDAFERAKYNGATINCFSSFVKNGVTTKDLLLLQVPVAEPWKVFSWLPVGDINGAPSNEMLMTASKHWYELCGAVPAVLDCGVIEYFVPNGRPSYDTALQIAREQFAICHERVLCLTRSHTLSELVDSLTKSCVWYLGWK